MTPRCITQAASPLSLGMRPLISAALATTAALALTVPSVGCGPIKSGAAKAGREAGNTATRTGGPAAGWRDSATELNRWRSRGCRSTTMREYRDAIQGRASDDGGLSPC